MYLDGKSTQKDRLELVPREIYAIILTHFPVFQTPVPLPVVLCLLLLLVVVDNLKVGH